MAKILLIEDVQTVLMAIRIILSGNGHQVASAKDGTVGLCMLGQSSYDMVISDVWMPGLSGQEVFKQGRLMSPGTRFLAITGGNPNSSGQPLETYADRYGADAILIKPFEKTELLGAVSDLLTKSRTEDRR